MSAIAQPLAFALAFAVTACGSSSSAPETKSAIEHGALLFNDSPSAGSYGNDFSCADCHSAGETSSRTFPGAPLNGVVARRAFWGGAELELLRAVNDCRSYFMAAAEPWSQTGAEAEAMYAYLASLSDGSSDTVTFTVPAMIGALACVPSDAGRGEILYDSACRRCHGQLHTGADRAVTRAPVLPDETLRAHAQHAPPEVRAAFVSKVRHGRFFDQGGAMPPFSLETLDDSALAALLEFVGVGTAANCP